MSPNNNPLKTNKGQLKLQTKISFEDEVNKLETERKASEQIIVIKKARKLSEYNPQRHQSQNEKVLGGLQFRVSKMRTLVQNVDSFSQTLTKTQRELDSPIILSALNGKFQSIWMMLSMISEMAKFNIK